LLRGGSIKRENNIMCNNEGKDKNIYDLLKEKEDREKIADMGKPRQNIYHNIYIEGDTESVEHVISHMIICRRKRC
jgi:hypothetical protein